MRNKDLFRRVTLVGLLMVAFLTAPYLIYAHPMGNFSISRYASIEVKQEVIQLRYLIDMAEIPTFQEIQETGIIPEPEHASLGGYTTRKAESLKSGLLLEMNGQPLRLRVESKAVIFSPGAGGLPTMKLGILYSAPLDGAVPSGPNRLRYRDDNFPGRAGWKEVVAVEGPEIVFVSSSVPDKDRSSGLTDYPTDLLNSPPQDVEAHVTFKAETSPELVAKVETLGSSIAIATLKAGRSSATVFNSEGVNASQKGVVSINKNVAGPPTEKEPIQLEANRQRTPRNSFTELVATEQVGFGILLIAAAVAAGLGAFHALEPGHGKTVVAAYLVGSRGTAWHALVLGLIVTASHTAGVYLLGAATLYASRYVLPERLYPWLGVISGLVIAGLGFSLFLRRYGGKPHSHVHGDHHGHGETPHSHGPLGEHSHSALGHSHHHHATDGTVSLRELLALGITGGIVPCPAALVVLLSALSLNRVGFGLFLIMAFSVGLAAVLIAIGLLMVYARRFMSQFQDDGLVITRWAPLTSAAVITLFGVTLAVRGLVGTGII